MANRNKNFNQTLAKEMQDFEFAQGYLLNLLSEHELLLQDALIESIEAMGLSAYAAKSGISIQYVSDFVHKRREYKAEIIDRFLRPFGLKVKLDVEKVAS